MTVRKRAIAVCSLLIASCGSVSSGGSTSTASEAAATTDPITKTATELAAVQEGGTPSSGDPLVQQFVTALTDLRPFCRENPEKLASEIYGAQQDLQKNNRPATLLRVAQSLDTLITGTHASAPRSTDCA